MKIYDVDIELTKLLDMLCSLNIGTNFHLPVFDLSQNKVYFFRDNEEFQTRVKA